jgi:hypothetical protein
MLQLIDEGQDSEPSERSIQNANKSTAYLKIQPPQIPFVFFVSFCSNPLQTFCLPPGKNQGAGRDEEPADSFTSRQALMQKERSKGHGHDHAELVDWCNLR